MTGAGAARLARGAPEPRAPGRAWRLFGRLLRCAAGVSAVEFALLAPVLVLGAFATADAGRAIYEQMMIGQSLRAAAQLAMAGADENDVRAVLAEVASENFAIAADGAVDATPDAGALSLTVDSYCACPGAGFTVLACTALCDSGLDATRFYRLDASKAFQGIMLPDFALFGSIDVVAE